MVSLVARGFASYRIWFGAPVHGLRYMGIWLPAMAGLSCVAFVALPLSGDAALAQAGRGPIQIAPHQAVYDITLVHANSGSGITDMSGRMVYELRGDACSGFTQKMRFVTRITDSSGSQQINDLRSSTWEGAGFERMHFDLKQYRNDRLTDSTKGDAGRSGAGFAPVDVQLEKPQKKSFQLAKGVYFPMQHSIALINAARAGQRHFSAKIYDGSDKGEKVFLTSAYIGQRLPKGTVAVPAEINSELARRSLPVWPVSISFFEPGQAHTDAVPSYELSFRFLENGVSTRLLMDYGDFSVRGELQRLELFDTPECRKD